MQVLPDILSRPLDFRLPRSYLNKAFLLEDHKILLPGSHKQSFPRYNEDRSLSVKGSCGHVRICKCLHDVKISTLHSRLRRTYLM